MPPSLFGSGNILVNGRKTILKSQGIEQGQAADSEGLSPVLFLVGFGDDVGYGAGHPGVASNLFCRLFQSVANNAGRRGYPVDALQIHCQGKQMIAQLLHRPTAVAAVRKDCAPGAMEPPFQILGGFQSGGKVIGGLEPFRVTDADIGQGPGVGPQAAIQLFGKETFRPDPLALQDDRIAGFQINPYIRSAQAAAPLGPGGDAALLQGFRQQGVDRFLADDFGGLGFGSGLHHRFPRVGSEVQYSKERGVMPVAGGHKRL